MVEYDLDKMTSKPMIKVIGVGGGGSNATLHMFKQGIEDVDFVICNTEVQHLNNNLVPIKVQLGKELTGGLGAGNNPQVGEEAAMESQQDIRDLLSDGTKMVFVTAGMGGGTGTGAAPVIAEIAQELGILTVGIVTVPIKAEGAKRVNQAIEGIEKLRRVVDSLLVISTERIVELYGDESVFEALDRANQILTVAAKGIAEIITKTSEGCINVDFADVTTVMQKSGVALMGSGQANGDDRCRKAVDRALSSPLLNSNDITSAKKVLLNIAAGKTGAVSASDITWIIEYIQRRVNDGSNNNAEVIWGYRLDESIESEIDLTIIATGFTQEIIDSWKDSPYGASKGDDDVIILRTDDDDSFEDSDFSDYATGKNGSSVKYRNKNRNIYDSIDNSKALVREVVEIISDDDHSDYFSDLTKEKLSYMKSNPSYNRY